MSSLPKFTIKEMLSAGVHFGHRTVRWNPKMQPYIYGSKNGIHIINLQKTVPLLHSALIKAKEVAENNGRILFVSTKRQASSVIAEAAKACGQYYVNHRWLGGMLTNWNTVSESIKTLQKLEKKLTDEEAGLTKKERLNLSRKVEKLELILGGIRNMGGTPDLIFIVDSVKEHIAIDEARKLGVPIIAIADTNSDPDLVDHIIPGNDDGMRAIELYCKLLSDSILLGLEKAFKNEEKTKKLETKNPKTDKKEAANTNAKEEKKETVEKKPTKKKEEKKNSTKKTTTKKTTKEADEKTAKTEKKITKKTDK